MKNCASCNAGNLDGAKFCNDCGAHFGEALPASKPSGDISGLTAADLAASLQSRAGQFASARRADVLFVLDVTGSMGGEILAIKAAIVDFANSIERDGVDIRVGMLAFWDRKYGEEPELLTFDGEEIYLVIRTMSPDSQVYLKLLSVTRGLAFELGKGDDFHERSEHFQQILRNLGKTISKATR